MALTVTPVNRNLQTRVTFLYLEFEDLFAVLLTAAVMNFVSRMAHGTLAGIPMSVVVQYGIPLSIVPLLMLFKYGKPRGYLRDLVSWYALPRQYSAAARDELLQKPYLEER